jgi:hypothetical protein
MLGLMLTLLGSLANVAFASPLRQSTGQVCVQAFDDVNANSTRDADEKLLAGVGFTLSDDSGVKGSYSTDGVSEPYCFGKLAGGSYTVRAKAPVGYESTTEGQWAISLANGAQFDAKYGANKLGGASTGPTNPSNTTGSPSTTTTTGGSGTSTFGRILLGGLGVIILLVAGFMAGMFVQRSRAK